MLQIAPLASLLAEALNLHMLTLNYKDGTNTITFDGLKAALDKENTGSDLDCLTAPY